MVKELILHLGDCKTGTTALQSTLASRHYDTGEIDLQYPAQFNHRPLAQTLSTLPEDAGERRHMARRWTQVARALRDSPAQYGIISAEHFEFTDPALLRRALQTHLPEHADTARLIAYVRPHHDRIVSTYAEAIKKIGGPSTMEAFFQESKEHRRFDYAPRFALWQAAFGDRFTLRPFVRDRLAGGDVVVDFLRYVTGSDAVSVTQAPLQNPALGLPDLAMMIELHAIVRRNGKDLIGARKQLGWNMAAFLTDTAKERGAQERLRMGAALCADVAETHRADAAALDAAFFEDAPMSAALQTAAERAIPTPQSLKIQDHFSPAEIALIRSWGGFMGQVIAADPAHFQWASKPANERTEHYHRPLTRNSLSDLVRRVRRRLF